MDDRELDALVAEKVMGWTRHVVANKPWQMLPPEGSAGRAEGRVYSVPHFSTDIAAAWQVVEKMRVEYGDKGHNGIVINSASVNGRKEWYVEFPAPLWEEATAPTAPKAICLAALRAVAVRR